MIRFTRLVKDLRQRVDRESRITALQTHLSSLLPQEAAWTLRLLADPPPPARISPRRLQRIAEDASGLPEWLLKASKGLANASEVAARILRQQEDADRIDTIEEAMENWAPRVNPEEPEALRGAWARMSGDERHIFNQLVSGVFRSPVHRGEAFAAASLATGAPVEAYESASLPCITPSAEWWRSVEKSAVRAHGVMTIPISTPFGWDEEEPVPEGWVGGWGLSGRLALLGWENGAMTVISQLKENFTTHFPDLAQAASALPDGCLLEGTIVAGACYDDLAKRLKAAHPGPALLKRLPARIVVHDVLAWAGEDLRDQPWSHRIRRLAGLSSGVIQMVESWAIHRPMDELALEARRRGSSGFWMRDPESEEADYFWTPAPPHLVRAVLTTLDGEGEATFAVRHGDELVPIARAPLEMGSEDVRAVRGYIRENTVEAFGPVRVVRPGLVIELAVHSFSPSRRRKAKVAAERVEIRALRRDLSVAEASEIEDIWAEIGLAT